MFYLSSSKSSFTCLSQQNEDERILQHLERHFLMTTSQCCGILWNQVTRSWELCHILQFLSIQRFQTQTLSITDLLKLKRNKFSFRFLNCLEVVRHMSLENLSLTMCKYSCTRNPHYQLFLLQWSTWLFEFLKKSKSSSFVKRFLCVQKLNFQWKNILYMP